MLKIHPIKLVKSMSKDNKHPQPTLENQHSVSSGEQCKRVAFIDSGDTIFNYAMQTQEAEYQTFSNEKSDNSNTK